MSNKTTKISSRSIRSRTISKAGYLFIGANFFLGTFNLIVGLVSGSLAITSDAIHSFVDSVSGFLIIVSEQLANHKNLTKHRNKIERATTILIALIIIAVGIHILVESIEEIIAPESPDYSAPTIVVLIASLAIKYLLAHYLKNTGEKCQSNVLVASSAETMNDAWISVAVLLSAIIYLFCQFDISAYVSIVIAIVIFKIGLEFIFPRLSRHHHHHLESNPNHDRRDKN